jgi:hypothetical protein
VTATAAATGYHQRLEAAHNARTIRANWGYVRPEKQTVEDQRLGATLGATGMNNLRIFRTRMNNEQ